jgi:hypothetical protein
MMMTLYSWILFVFCWNFCDVEGFGIAHLSVSRQQQQQHRQSVNLYLVSEEDVLSAVETAEALWAEALEARKTSNALSDRAEEEAEAASNSAMEIDAMFKNANKDKTAISMQQLAQGDAAARANLDAGSMVNKALQSSDEAERLEKLAEEALQTSEEQLEQHLKDYPDSALAL